MKVYSFLKQLIFVSTHTHTHTIHSTPAAYALSNNYRVSYPTVRAHVHSSSDCTGPPRESEHSEGGGGALSAGSW